MANQLRQWRQNFESGDCEPGGGGATADSGRERAHLLLHLNVQLDVLREAGSGEVAGTDQRLRPYNLELGMRDISLCVELLTIVHAALNPPIAKRFENGRYAC